LSSHLTVVHTILRLLYRALEDSRTGLEFARRRLEQARVNHEETTLWKNSLCDQLHLLVRDSNRYGITW
jgi:hypothetical protein